MSDFEEDFYYPGGSSSEEEYTEIGAQKYGYDYADLQRTMEPSYIEFEQGAARDPRTSSLYQITVILNDPEYEDFSDYKEKVKETAEKIPENELLTLNVDILAPALLYLSKYSNINHNDISSFIKRTNNKLENVNHLDFIRYVRNMSKHF